MRRLLIVVLLVSVPAFAEKFVPGCVLPERLAAISEEHEIDNECGISGPSTSNAAKKAESRAKNNFCASGEPALVTVNSFKALQRKADAKGKGFGKKDDRSELQGLHTTTEGDTIGEGSLVTFAGFIVEAHHSNLGKGEAVNCKRGGQEWNDIHIVIASDPNEKNFCKTITAEMSPHLRPEIWNPENLELLEGTKVRFTGSLFFDSSHSPCRMQANGTFKKASPARISVWEIHPVYALDVCDAPSCAANSDDGWLPFEEYVGGLMEEEEEVEH